MTFETLSALNMPYDLLPSNYLNCHYTLLVNRLGEFCFHLTETVVHDQLLYSHYQTTYFV